MKLGMNQMSGLFLYSAYRICLAYLISSPTITDFLLQVHIGAEPSAGLDIRLDI